MTLGLVTGLLALAAGWYRQEDTRGPALFMVSLDNLVVTTALPVIKRDLGASLSGLEWTVNGYTLGGPPPRWRRM